MSAITDEEWKNLKEIGKNMPKIPEELDRTITRKLMQDAPMIPLLFEASRREIKDKIKTLDEMEENIIILNASDDFKRVFELMCFFVKKEQEEQLSQWDFMEAIALNQIELRKDVTRLIKATKKTKENQKVVAVLQNKIKQSDSDLKEFRKSKHYIEFTKRFWDERASVKEND